MAETVASFTKEVNWRLAKRPLVFNGRLANRQLTSLVKEATGESLIKYPWWELYCPCGLGTHEHDYIQLY